MNLDLGDHYPHVNLVPGFCCDLPCYLSLIRSFWNIFLMLSFFYEIRCSMEMQYLIRHRFETPSTWIGTSVNLICTALTHFLIQDCTILSGDVIIRYLAEELKPDFVVFLVSNILCNESILISWFQFTFHSTWAKCQINTGCDILRQCFCTS